MSVEESTHLYSRSEWSGLSIRERIRAMNASLTAENSPERQRVQETMDPASHEEEEEDRSMTDPCLESEAEAEPEPSLKKEEEDSREVCLNSRSSVIDIWRQRECQNQMNASLSPQRSPRRSNAYSLQKPFKEKKVVELEDDPNHENVDHGTSTGPASVVSVPSDGYPECLSSKTTLENNAVESTLPSKKLVVDTTLLPPEMKSLTSKEIQESRGHNKSLSLTDHSQFGLGLNESKGSVEEEIHLANTHPPIDLKKQKQQQRRSNIVDIWTLREGAVGSPPWDTRESPASITSNFFNKELEEPKKIFDDVQNSITFGTEPAITDTMPSRPQNLPTGRRSLSVLERWKKGMIHTDSFSSSQENSPPPKGRRKNQKEHRVILSSPNRNESDGYEKVQEGKVGSVTDRHSPNSQSCPVTPRCLHKEFEGVKDTPVQGPVQGESSSPTSNRDLHLRSLSLDMSVCEENFQDKAILIPTATRTVSGRQTMHHDAESATSEDHSKHVSQQEDRFNVSSELQFGNIRDDLSQMGKVKSITAAFMEQANKPVIENIEKSCVCKPRSHQVVQRKKASVLDRWINREAESPSRSNEGNGTHSTVCVKFFASGGDGLERKVNKTSDGEQNGESLLSLNHSMPDGPDILEEEASLQLDYSQESVLSSKSDLSPPIESSLPGTIHFSLGHESDKQSAKQDASASSNKLKLNRKQSSSNFSSPSDEENSTTSSISVYSPGSGRLGASPFSSLIKNEETRKPTVTTFGKSLQMESNSRRMQRRTPSVSPTKAAIVGASSILQNGREIGDHNKETKINEAAILKHSNLAQEGDFPEHSNDNNERAGGESSTSSKQYQKHFTRLLMQHDMLLAEKNNHSNEVEAESKQQKHEIQSANELKDIAQRQKTHSDDSLAADSTSSEASEATGPRPAHANNDCENVPTDKPSNLHPSEETAADGTLIRPVPATPPPPTSPRSNHSKGSCTFGSQQVNSSCVATGADRMGSDYGQSDALSFFSHAGSAFSGYSAHSSGISSTQFQSGGRERKEEGKLQNGQISTEKEEGERYAQDIARNVLTRQETVTRSHLTRHAQYSGNSSEHPKRSYSIEPARKGGVGLAERYNTSSRFLSKDDAISTDASLGVEFSTVSSAPHPSNVSSSYCSDTSRSYDSAASESAYTGISEVYSAQSRKTGKRSTKKGKALQQELSDAFQNAYQSFGINNMSENVPFSKFLNESVQAASSTFQKIVDKTESIAPVSTIAVSSCNPTVPRRANATEASREEDEEITIGEGIAIEVEYVSESDDEESEADSLSSDENQSQDCDDTISLG